jgi:hypothetical protein
VLISSVGGATISEIVGEEKNTHRQTVILASDLPGVVEHEAMHAYCLHNFGATGPDWYKEGMAEMAAFGEGESNSVLCPPERLAVLREGPVRPIHQILDASQLTARVSDSLSNMLANRRVESPYVALSAWATSDSTNVDLLRREYVWNWALCHLLYYNPNYSDRFRMAGIDYLSNPKGSFEILFAPMQDELKFEYGLFVQQVDVGYRTDLCAWDWKTQFRGLDDKPIKGKYTAARGWQASRVLVTAGETYSYRAKGNWAISASEKPTNVNGTSNGAGKLIGAVLSDEFQLSPTVELGTQGTFVAPISGKLYLRCQDAWNQLSDNRGEVSVRISRGRLRGTMKE